MTILGIDHVQLAMPAGGEEEARRFYSGILGIPEKPKPAELARRGGVWFEDGTVKIHLGVEADFRPARKAHPALLVRRLRDLVERLHRAGIDVEDAPAGYHRVYVADPFGNRLELMEGLEPQRRDVTGRAFAERLHFIPRLIRYPQSVLVRLFRSTLEHAPGWVLLTTTGRKSGLPREVLLPCERFDASILVISTYGWRSNWIRNIRRDPKVRVTGGGSASDGRAEIIEALDRKQALVSAHPFFVPFPTSFLNLLHRTVLRPLWVPFLRWWVRRRPVVVVHVG